MAFRAANAISNRPIRRKYIAKMSRKRIIRIITIIENDINVACTVLGSSEVNNDTRDSQIVENDVKK